MAAQQTGPAAGTARSPVPTAALTTRPLAPIAGGVDRSQSTGVGGSSGDSGVGAAGGVSGAAASAVSTSSSAAAASAGPSSAKTTSNVMSVQQRRQLRQLQNMESVSSFHQCNIAECRMLYDEFTVKKNYLIQQAMEFPEAIGKQALKFKFAQHEPKPNFMDYYADMSAHRHARGCAARGRRVCHRMDRHLIVPVL
jgi:hypothetical protein